MTEKADSTKRTAPLRVMFLITSMPVGGAETLLVNLMRKLDRSRFAAEVCCLKEPGPLGEELSAEFQVHSHLLSSKYDLRVLPRLVKLLRARKIDAVITVGAGDKMFWGRLAAWIARTPVVLSALHSTGWPDGVGRLNRCLTSITDGFIGVAESHGEFLKEFERFPADKVYVIPNGVDTERFAPLPAVQAVRQELGIAAEDPVVGIVAALRPEKNHTMFLQSARQVLQRVPKTHFLIVGDGPELPALKTIAHDLDIARQVHFLGTRSDIPEVLATMDVFALTSHNEANPVSILEAMAVGKPICATDVGSVRESVRPEVTGYLVPPGDVQQMSERICELLENPLHARQLGSQGREQVLATSSLEVMVHGYQRLIETIYQQKRGQLAWVEEDALDGFDWRHAVSRTVPVDSRNTNVESALKQEESSSRENHPQTEQPAV